MQRGCPLGRGAMAQYLGGGSEADRGGIRTRCSNPVRAFVPAVLVSARAFEWHPEKVAGCGRPPDRLWDVGKQDRAAVNRRHPGRPPNSQSALHGSREVLPRIGRHFPEMRYTVHMNPYKVGV